MRTTLCFLITVACIGLGAGSLKAEPPAKADRKSKSADSTKTNIRDPSRARLLESANGWMYVNGEWIHPAGYKLVNNKVVRTTAKAGKTFPSPPGKLALENPTKLAPRPKSAAEDAQTAAEKAAEIRRKNLAPPPASQTGTHL